MAVEQAKELSDGRKWNGLCYLHNERDAPVSNVRVLHVRTAARDQHREQVRGYARSLDERVACWLVS
jgi:hypothetical protein